MNPLLRHGRSPSQISLSSSNFANICNSCVDPKDELIFELKKRIIELEQKEDSFNQLNLRYKQLQGDNDTLTEEKFELQHEIKNNKESLHKQILNLRAENENLQIVLNDKLLANKKIFQEKDTLSGVLNNKIDECQILNGQMNNMSIRLNKAHEEKNDFEKMVHELKENNASQNVEISKITEDNILLTKLLQEQDKVVLELKEDKEGLILQLNSLNRDYHSSLEKIRVREVDIDKIQDDLVHAQKKITFLQSELFDYQNDKKSQQKEISLLKNSLKDERNSLLDHEKEIDYLNNTIRKIEGQLSQYKDQLSSEQLVYKRNLEEKASLQVELGKLKKTLMAIIQQNDDLISVIEDIKALDEDMKNELSRKKRIEYVIRENKQLLRDSIEGNHINPSNNYNIERKHYEKRKNDNANSGSLRTMSETKGQRIYN